MGAYDNTNRGVLFSNRDKKTDKHPDLQGTINIEGVDYFMSGWKKESSQGTKFISLSVKKRDPNFTGNSEQPAIEDIF